MGNRASLNTSLSLMSQLIFINQNKLKMSLLYRWNMQILRILSWSLNFDTSLKSAFPCNPGECLGDSVKPSLHSHVSTRSWPATGNALISCVMQNGHVDAYPAIVLCELKTHDVKAIFNKNIYSFLLSSSSSSTCSSSSSKWLLCTLGMFYCDICYKCIVSVSSQKIL